MSRSEEGAGVPDSTPGEVTRAAGRQQDHPTARLIHSVERAPDDSDIGWGERPDDADADARYLEDRPPHWGSD